MLPILPPAQVEVDAERRYINANDSACKLLGYSREELLRMKIDDVSAPSGAHVPIMFERYVKDGEMHGIFALRRKSGEVISVRFVSNVTDGRRVAQWTHWEPWEERKRRAGQQ